ncbi:MAG: phosphoribosyltransferase [Verrucomicrobiales bacterium]|nr:phosphoribosyltransferase [Verrucomicrobiales bacterium]
MDRRFSNRREAGRELAKKLRHYAYHPEAMVLALPRGGVPVAYEIASELHLPLHVFVVRKLGVPGHEELAMGAVASGGTYFLNRPIVQQLGVSDRRIEAVLDDEKAEVERREKEYGADHPLDLQDRTIILVDDGLATGSTMRAAVRALREKSPHKIVIAVPVAPLETFQEFENEGEEMVVVLSPEIFFAVGEWYDDFEQVSDEEVREILRRAEKQHANSSTKPVIF